MKTKNTANHPPAPTALSAKHRQSLLAALVLTALAPASAMAQTYSFYGFGTTETSFTTASTTSSNVSPAPANGTNIIRVGSGGGSVLFTNSQIATLGTNSQMRLIAPTGASINKLSVFDIDSPSSAFYLKQFVAFGNTNYDGTANSGTISLFTGNGTTFANANAFSGSDSFSGLRIGISNTGALNISNRAGSSWSAMTGTGLTQTNVFALEIMGNNSASATNYNYGGIERTLSAYTFDLWVGGTLVASNMAKALLANGTSIDSFMWYAESSTANVAAIFLDSITYANGIATNSGRTFWTTNGAAAQSGVWGTVGTTGATVGWGATATISEGSPWVDNNTAVFSANSTYTVTVTNNVRAANLEFLAGNALLTNGTVQLTFSNAAVTVTNGIGATVASVVDGTAGFRKTGAGTLTLAGGSANTYSGAVAVNAGTLELKKADNTAAITGAISVTNGATLLLSASEQVANTGAVTLSGGTIQRGTGVSETFGDLTLTANSTLNFGGASESKFLQFGNLTLGGFTLTVSNFQFNNQLRYNAVDEAEGDAIFATFNLVSSFGQYEKSFDSGLFTITAIPEPSTYAAAAGLLGLMLWPARRRLVGLISRKA